MENMAAFRNHLASVDWGCLSGTESSGMVEIFDQKISELYDQYFPERTVKTRSSDLPWVTKRIKRIIRRKKRRYKRSGKDRTWVYIDRFLQDELRQNRIRHLDKVKKKVLDNKNPRAYHAAINLLKEKAPLPRWSPNALFPDKSDQEVAEECASFFNAISSEFRQIEEPSPPPAKLLAPTVHQVARKLKSIRKTKTLVPGDIDARVVNYNYDLLAVPLAIIFDKVYSSCSWPSKWSTETVTIIPKNNAPDSLGETRNISCTPLFSKLLETFLLDSLKQCVRLNGTQFGGIKGVGVDHFLVETWDEILRAVDTGGKAVNLMSIDFQKAFNRMDHATCLQRLRHKGAPEHLVQLVGAFLYGRTMTVKIGQARSVPRGVNGGAPQGSILGPYLFCVVSEILADTVSSVHIPDFRQRVGTTAVLTASEEEDDSTDSMSGDPESSGDEWAAVESQFNFFRKRRINPLDDTAVSNPPEYMVHGGDEVDPAGILPRPTVKAYIDDFNIIEVIDTSNAERHVTTEKTTMKIHVPQSETVFEAIEDKAKDISMVVNTKKTQMLCISQNNNYNINSFMYSGGKKIESCDKLKILGFTFDKNPSCAAQIRFLLGNFRARLWSLRVLAEGGLCRPDLLKFYATSLRPVLEYTQVTYHSMLSASQAAELERGQAKVLKIIFGAEVSYGSALRDCSLPRLEERRRAAFEKFAVKASTNDRVKDKWFPAQQDSEYNIRVRKTYQEEHARTDKLWKSPLFAMRRFLNTRFLT